MGIKTIITMLGIGISSTIVSVVLEALGKYNQAKLTEVLGIVIMACTTITGVLLLAENLMKLI
ncbi:putative membrane protein (plasmid) [Clostridium baratii str. Sullivan]|uniref:Putative membrane protein n=1 Tax=Clostridium baratii str. Sullivan TaxID=1415775 RepID=A0A0A7G0L3_9CLOT|nr:hypothetical protein [Clostridium baratii]AIY85373.1 putative membrane protein [Clostridium baratii str. Sullivan]